jgi:hypothetical protein
MSQVSNTAQKKAGNVPQKYNIASARQYRTSLPAVAASRWMEFHSANTDEHPPAAIRPDSLTAASSLGR